MSLPITASAKRRPASEIFSTVVGTMDAARRVQFCGFVAQTAVDQASETSDLSLRSARYASAQELQSRLAGPLKKANAGLSQDRLATLTDENGEALGLLSYSPSPRLAAQIEQGGNDDVIGLFLSDVVTKCNVLLDSMGVAPSVAVPAKAIPITPSFKWRGKTAEEAFEGTGLARFAMKICSGAESKPSDFAGANFAGRGKDSVSLLDWALECRDKSAFKALLDGGYDAATPGQFGIPPMVTAADADDPWYSTELLAHGVSPDSFGDWQTALAAAYEPLEDGGGKRFKMLRKAGASLNFPRPDQSMWAVWGVHADWEAILANWSEFKSDPVALGWTVSWELSKPIPRGNKTALEELKARLITDYAVCFPVQSLHDMKRDERGYLVQQGCSKHEH